MTCEFLGRCKSGDKGSCYRCFNKDLLRLPEDKIRAQRRRAAGHLSNSGKAKKQESWQNTELQGAVRAAALPSAVEMEARINPGSGNQSHRPGDWIDDVIFNETKERQPRITASGKMSMTIEKGWLDKTIQESQGRDKFPMVNFKFKGTEDLYTFLKYDTILELAHMVKYLKTELFMSRQQLKSAMEQLQILQQQRDTD